MKNKANYYTELMSFLEAVSDGARPVILCPLHEAQDNCNFKMGCFLAWANKESEA